eukprot:TRINITY_DN4735_c1_g1_i11.p1 TRINITY_DN4735_c1_g1~~TRINITY_DN4735_c1_g1_i11.p1  ORF type:complete len:257 (-),score=61.18 TRINITY_DN4735_c1_g1_i11:374-1144(-)
MICVFGDVLVLVYMRSLKEEYYKKIEKESTNIVLLEQIPDICRVLNVNIQVNTLKKKEGYYDLEQKHFLLVRTFNGYADILQCSFCRRVYTSNNYDELRQHELQHSNTETKESDKKFKKKEIQKPFYLAYDFESMLIPQETEPGTRMFTHLHQPIAFVLKGWSEVGFEYQFAPVLYSGIDAGKKFVEVLFQKYSKEWTNLENWVNVNNQDKDKKKMNCFGFQFRKIRYDLRGAAYDQPNHSNRKHHHQGQFHQISI